MFVIIMAIMNCVFGNMIYYESYYIWNLFSTRVTFEKIEFVSFTISKIKLFVCLFLFTFLFSNIISYHVLFICPPQATAKTYPCIVLIYLHYGIEEILTHKSFTSSNIFFINNGLFRNNILSRNSITFV